MADFESCFYLIRHVATALEEEEETTAMGIPPGHSNMRVSYGVFSTKPNHAIQTKDVFETLIRRGLIDGAVAFTDLIFIYDTGPNVTKMVHDLERDRACMSDDTIWTQIAKRIDASSHG